MFVGEVSRDVDLSGCELMPLTEIIILVIYLQFIMMSSNMATAARLSIILSMFCV